MYWYIMRPNITFTSVLTAGTQTWRKNKTTYSVLYHGPVWITLNSFIWNIKTMKHKPSTKRQLHVSHHTALREKKKKTKWGGYTGKWLLFERWRRYTEQTVKCEHDYAIYTLQILPDSEKDKRGGKEKEKAEENGTAVFVWLRPRPRDLKGSCDWSERIRQSGSAAKPPRRDNH